ncbi:hypothetical protein E5288_WYG018613 [Bos mutus]|uniref:Uncharacterized protein n=1 Tax=Bos mutus TaxID=72004 RepID=A0A6B0R413_9CETA|nr:hypothetical protein [Bos mutus]
MAIIFLEMPQSDVLSHEPILQGDADMGPTQAGGLVSAGSQNRQKAGRNQDRNHHLHLSGATTVSVETGVCGFRKVNWKPRKDYSECASNKTPFSIPLQILKRYPELGVKILCSKLELRKGTHFIYRSLAKFASYSPKKPRIQATWLYLEILLLAIHIQHATGSP